MINQMASPDAPRVLAIVQAGGQGSRMGVLTTERAKPALPVGGTHQLIDVALSNVVNSGISSVWVAVQYLASSLDAHIQHGRPWDLDRSYGGFRRVVPEEAPGDLRGGFATGNADLLYRMRGEIAAENPDIVIVLSADQIFSLDLRQVVQQHLTSGADATLVSADVTKSEAASKAVLTIDATGRITQVVEKPDEPERTTVSAEIMVFNTEVLLQGLEDAAADTVPDADHGDTGLGDVAEKLLPQMVSNFTFRAFPIDGYWRDMGRPALYLQAHRDLVRGKVRIFNDPDWPMRTLGVDRGAAWVREGADVTESLLSAGCDVAGTVKHSTLAEGVIVRAGAVVEDSIIMEDCVIEKDAVIRSAIVDERVKVRAGAVIGETPKSTSVRDEDVAIVGHDSVVRTKVAPGEQVEPRSEV